MHPEVLARQQLPASLVTRRVWTERYEDINAFERYLARNGTLIRKFFLHVSKEEQRRRFLERLDDPAKNWKFEAADLGERDRWDDYMKAYEEALSKTSTNHAPWFIVPADHKWFTRLAIARLLKRSKISTWHSRRPRGRSGRRSPRRARGFTRALDRFRSQR
jgi:polyphosphate kinase 2 (PPK2 family)